MLALGGKTALLGGGMKWQGLALMSAEDAQLTETRRFSTEDIGRLFGIPGWLLNSGGKDLRLPARARRPDRFRP
jgi:phage portal protein BeeE